LAGRGIRCSRQVLAAKNLPASAAREVAGSLQTTKSCRVSDPLGSAVRTRWANTERMRLLAKADQATGRSSFLVDSGWAATPSEQVVFQERPMFRKLPR
jgi:hypothetical protein